MMRRTAFVLLVIISFVGELNAQSIRTSFLNIPDSLTPLLTSVNRADFIDFIDSEMEAKVKNRLDGYSIMKELTDNYIFIEMTTRSSFEVKCLPYKNSVLFVVVESVLGPVKNSIVSFYDAKWNPLEGRLFFDTPVLSDFVKNDISNEMFLNLSKVVDVGFHEINLCPNSSTLQIKLTSIDYLEKKQVDKYKPFICHGLDYQWTGESFKPVPVK